MEPKKNVSGTETRQRAPRVYARVTGAERETIESAAAAQGVSVGAYLRSLAIERPQTRGVRRALPSEALLMQLKAEAGRVDGNLAQLLKLANRGDFVAAQELTEASNAVRDCWRHILAMLRQ